MTAAGPPPDCRLAAACRLLVGCLSAALTCGQGVCPSSSLTGSAGAELTLAKFSPLLQICDNGGDHGPYGLSTTPFGAHMSKRARKRRSRKGNAANHGRKPNA